RLSRKGPFLSFQGPFFCTRVHSYRFKVHSFAQGSILFASWPINKGKCRSIVELKMEVEVALLVSLKPVRRSKLRIFAGKKVYRLKRYGEWLFDGKKYARKRLDDK